MAGKTKSKPSPGTRPRVERPAKPTPESKRAVTQAKKPEARVPVESTDGPGSLPLITLERVTSSIADELAVGHSSDSALRPQDEALFRAFQSNLLSLISHELRTPLMGILNSLHLLEGGEDGGTFSREELVSMARRNAERLNRTLSALLDLAALDSGTFQVRLKEVDLERVVRGRIDAHADLLRDVKLATEVRVEEGASGRLRAIPLLADPQKLGRAIDLCLDAMIPRADTSVPISLRISSSKVHLWFKLRPGSEDQWRESWTQAMAGHEGGVPSPGSAFAGTLQSEQAFLSRMEEGLGSELLLIHQILLRHQGQFTLTWEGEGEARRVILTLSLPELSSEDGLRAVLGSRSEQATMELGSLALVLIRVPAGIQPEAFRVQIQKSLFRASDAVYPLPERGQVALVMDDCRPEDVPRLLPRIEKNLGQKLRCGLATCPADGFDPAHLVELANRRLEGPSG